MSQIPYITTVEDPYEIIAMLKSASSKITEYIDTQQYLVDADPVDAITEQSIIADCYDILINELEEKGIFFSENIDDILASYADSERIYHLHEWIDTAHQITMVTTHREMIPLLENIINTEDSEDDYLTQWIQATYPRIATTDPHLAYIVPILPYIHTTSLFLGVLKYIFEHVQDELDRFHQPIEKIAAYTKFMLDGQNNAKKAFEILVRNEKVYTALGGDIPVERLRKEMNNYDMAKLAPYCISDYTWAWMVEEGEIHLEDLPPDLQKKYEELEVEHHTTTDHHIEYYLANRDIPVDPKAVILLLSACYTPKDPDKTKEKIEKISHSAGDLFSTDIASFFLACGYILVAYTQGEIA